MDSWLASHEFEPGAAEDPPYRRSRCSLNLSKLKRRPVGVVWKLGEEASSSGTIVAAIAWWSCSWTCDRRIMSSNQNASENPLCTGTDAGLICPSSNFYHWSGLERVVVAQMSSSSVDPGLK
ncbi:hypothetical protein TNCV_298751 [Trichonephila clavipes]|nr:hypothetical protein TNCV_298751 [Trichonephila clavipes]